MPSGLSKFGAPRINVCNLYISGEFPLYTSGSSYLGTVDINGGTAPYTVELLTGSDEPSSTSPIYGSNPDNGANNGMIIGSVPSTAMVGVTTVYQLNAVGLTGVVNWTISTSASGFSIAQDGKLTFTPTVTGDVSVTVTATALTDSKTASAKYYIRVTTAAAEVPISTFGSLFNGYVNAPYFQNCLAGEGFTFSRPPNGKEWYSNASTGMPENITWASCYACGTPTTAGTYNWTQLFNISGTFDYLPASGTFTIAASPTNTVLNMADRAINDFSILFKSDGPAPMLRVIGNTASNNGSGYVRSLNGHTTGKRYWEVKVNALPANAAFESWLTVGVDKSNIGIVNYDYAQTYTGAIDYPNAGGFFVDKHYFGYSVRRPSGTATYNSPTLGGPGSSNVGSPPAIVAGDVLSFAHDADTGKLWIAINGAWIGGGDPAAGTTATITGLNAATTPRFTQWKPFVTVIGGVDVTFNFGDQSYAHTVPSGFSNIAFAKVTEFSRMVLDSDTMDTRGPNGFKRGVFVVSRTGAGGIIYSPERYAIGIRPRESLGDNGEVPTIRGTIPKSTGKWHVELVSHSFIEYACIGLVPYDWVQSVGGGPGFTTDSFGVFARGEVRNGGSLVASPSEGGVLTLAVDLDASPQTVRVMQDNNTIGTYNLPNTGKPWVPVLGYAGIGYARVAFDTLIYPQSGFQDWTA